MNCSYLLAFLLVCVLSLSSLACTTFVYQQGEELYFGRTLDWVSDNGVVVVNKRGVQKESLVFPGEKPTSWTSNYGSVTFNQFGAEFPYGGMNEKGLVVEIMRAPAAYPREDSRTALNELQWVQYQLDNAATIEDVVASDEFIRIAAINQQLHFLICDASGSAVAIEFIKGEMHVFDAGDQLFSVLENDPYSVSVQKYSEGVSCRYGTAMNELKSLEESSESSPVAELFTILDHVKLNGAWSIIYDIRQQEIHFRTASHNQIRHLDFGFFDFNCNSPRMLIDLDSTGHESVEQGEQFSFELNRAKMMDGLYTNGIDFPPLYIEALVNYPLTVTCDQ